MVDWLSSLGTNKHEQFYWIEYSQHIQFGIHDVAPPPPHTHTQTIVNRLRTNDALGGRGWKVLKHHPKSSFKIAKQIIWQWEQCHKNFCENIYIIGL